MYGTYDGCTMGFCEQTGELSFFPLLDERLDEKYHRVVSAMIDDR